MKAQGNALGKWHNKTPSPERAKYESPGQRPGKIAQQNPQP